MHSFQFCTRVACVLADGSARAPFLKFWDPVADWRARSTQPESATTPEPPAGASSTRTRTSSTTAFSCIVCN
eukprot:3140865-Pleurochrysis_carterae.AAC.1